jgi:chromosome segregation ATPase
MAIQRKFAGYNEFGGCCTPTSFFCECQRMSSESDRSEVDCSAPRAERRIDQPHAIDRGASHLVQSRSAMQPVAAAVGEAASALETNVERSLEQLREHAAQLADRLQGEQGALDRREKELAAQAADLEAKWDTARQWLAERQEELDARAEGVSLREQEVSQREATAEQRATQLTQVREEALTERENRLGTREAELQRSLTDLESRVAALDHDRVEWNERHEKLQSREAAIEGRQRELDQRQAQLYLDIEQLTAGRAREADRLAEIERREAKVADWEARLQARTSELEQQTDTLRQRAGELEFERAELRKTLSDISGRETELEAAEQQLNYRQQEIEAAIARFERLGVTEERMHQMQEEARKYAVRRRYLDEAEAQLTQEKEELTDQLRALANERRQWQEQALRERRAVAAQQQVAQTEQQHRAQQLDAREAEIDARENALAQLQSELRATQREILEMRLATEETWAQLSGALAPASLTRSIAQVRAKLADHYRAVLDEMKQRSEQLEGVRQDLARQLDAVESQRQELGDWAERRHADIETQAARLVAREQELDRQQQHYEQMESRWSIERTDYQSEIRRLLATIREIEVEELRAA